MTDQTKRQALDDLAARLDPTELDEVLALATALAVDNPPAPAPGLPTDAGAPGTTGEPAAIDNTQPNENTVPSSSDQPAVTPGDATSTPDSAAAPAPAETVPQDPGAADSTPSSTPADVPPDTSPAPDGGGIPATGADTGGHSASDASALISQAIDELNQAAAIIGEL